ncbi:hypothetical protein GCM10012275_02160 [Longimycelium tulufanense]|uniref:Uncharacterized protein n=1 Tax=Longimycelium tulufanense TaxID=907463 RepID=A0A8J3C9K6_9PSEU|nr:hypothetical protein [Longimycelium tulufanense]GGM34391.1 hypothetical protein GCM10012275_02160 [Longimycelium tulufanense]
MPKIVFPLKLHRRFEFFSYIVGHGGLLLRSRNSAEYPTRIELMFKDIEEMRLQNTMEELEIDLITDPERINDQLGVTEVHESRHVFALSAANFRTGYVVAGALYLAEDDLGFSEPSAIEHKDLESHVMRSEYFND